MGHRAVFPVAARGGGVMIQELLLQMVVVVAVVTRVEAGLRCGGL